MTLCLQGEIDLDPSTFEVAHDAQCRAFRVVTLDQPKETRVPVLPCGEPPCFELIDDPQCDVFGSRASVRLHLEGTNVLLEEKLLVECRRP